MIEVLAVFFTILSVYLTSRRNILCWITGIVGIIFYFWIFVIQNNIMNSSLQIIFLVQSLFGWMKWKNENIKISFLENDIMALLLLSSVLLSILLYFISNYFGGSNSFLDSVTTSLSIFALFLTSFRKIESWYFWILADILFVIMFFQNKLYLSSFIYFMFSGIAIYGLKNWIRVYKNDRL